MLRGAISVSFFALLLFLSPQSGFSTPSISKELENKTDKLTKKKGSLSNLFPIKSATTSSRGDTRFGRAHLTDGHDEEGEQEPSYWTSGVETCVSSDGCPAGIGLNDILDLGEWEDCTSTGHLREVHGVELTGIWGNLHPEHEMVHLVVKLDYDDFQESENLFLVGKWFCKRCMEESSVPEKYRIGQGDFPLYHFQTYPGQSHGYYQVSVHLPTEIFNMVQEGGFYDGFRIKVKRGKRDMRLCKFFVWGHEDYGDEECSSHGLDHRYTPNNCPAGCECCRENGSCGECSSDNVCIHGSDYKYCQSCHSMFNTEEEIQNCLQGAGEGFDHNGNHYDNTCGNE
jgi:hypothetical protein